MERIFQAINITYFYLCKDVPDGGARPRASSDASPARVTCSIGVSPCGRRRDRPTDKTSGGSHPDAAGTSWHTKGKRARNSPPILQRRVDQLTSEQVGASNYRVQPQQQCRPRYRAST